MSDPRTFDELVALVKSRLAGDAEALAALKKIDEMSPRITMNYEHPLEPRGGEGRQHGCWDEFILKRGNVSLSIEWENKKMEVNIRFPHDDLTVTNV